MAHFSFRGDISASKSLFNRALIAKSFYSGLDLDGFSKCDDVLHMQKAIQGIETRSDIYCGDAGTVLRFMAFRVAREPGWHWLRGSHRLMSRPQNEVIEILSQLGVSAQLLQDGIFVSSEGWKDPKKVLRISRSDSSQFASGLALSAWNLSFDLSFEFSGGLLSESYWQMTVDLLLKLGMELSENQGVYTIPAGQKIKLNKFEVEADLSSIFIVAVAAALSGQIEVNNWPQESVQPDRVFTEIFDSMNVKYRVSGGHFNVSQQEGFSGAEIDVSNCPDLFPALALLCGYANGSSRIYGAPHLAKKESNRIKKTSELLRSLGILCAELSDGIFIEGTGGAIPLKSFDFDPDQDHRMAMAAGIAQLLGHDIRISSIEAVNKSFPEFWDIIQS
jgi:3-phosphoshikimate 1-carboxyvinyltransferase